MAILVAGVVNYWKNPEFVYWQGEETNDQVAWLQENIQEDEDVYVYFPAKFGFQYRNGYGNNSIGPFHDNLIYGTTYFMEEDECQEELRTILDHDKIYIATSHLLYAEVRMKLLLEGIRREGHLQMIRYRHATPLFWYCRDLADGRISATWETVENDTSDIKQRTRVKIHNTGTAYINHAFETVYLTNKAGDFKVALPKYIEPDRTIEVWVPDEIEKDSEMLLVNDEGLICSENQFTKLHGSLTDPD